MMSKRVKRGRREEEEKWEIRNNISDVGGFQRGRSRRVRFGRKRDEIRRKIAEKVMM